MCHPVWSDHKNFLSRRLIPVADPGTRARLLLDDDCDGGVLVRQVFRTHAGQCPGNMDQTILIDFSLYSPSWLQWHFLEFEKVSLFAKRLLIVAIGN